MNRVHVDRSAPQTAFADIPERTFSGASLTGRVRMDGTRFVNCRFRDATLVYAGLAGTELNGCTFEATQVEFVGPARNTLAVLKAMAMPRSGLAAIVRATFPQVFGH